MGAFIGVLELFDNAAAREMSLRDEGRQDGERVPRKEVVDTEVNLFPSFSFFTAPLYFWQVYLLSIFP